MLARVLGALEIDGAGVQVSIGGPVPRRLLTALLARPGAAVPADSLLDAAWGDDPPPSADRTLQSHLARLRYALAPSATIERGPGGYTLVIAPEDIDAQRFETLVARTADADPHVAVPLLREALALWRSPVPYADLQDTAYPAAEAARLTELRGTAAESLAAALLDAGDSAGAIAESEARLGEDPYRERLWETLVVALYREGRQGDALAAYRRARRELDEGLGIEPGPRLREIEAQVLAQDPSLLNGHRAPARQPCPYKGLTRYEPGDAELYVGRERLVEELLARLVDTRFLVVVGPSGAGKSSLVRAGLVPALAAGGLPGSAAWTSRVIVPGEDPLQALATALEDRLDVLVVDQAEEALLADGGEGIAAFGDAVLAAVGSGTRVVLALRADFYGLLAEHPALARRVGPASVLVAPPDEDELRRIVTEPAARVGLRVEPALADLVVGEVRGRPGALPVLSTALVRTWEHRDDGVLTVESYRAGGGVEGALQRVGEEAWIALETAEQRTACRRMMMRLALDENGQWVRRRARRAEVAPPGDAAAAAALAVLADRRLVVASADDIEVAHEALLTGWPRLFGWLEDGRAHAEVRERLAAAVAEWEADGRDESELYAGTRLQAALDTQAASPDDLSPLEAAFLAESSAYAERALTEQRERGDREARGRRRIRAVAAGLAAALVVAAAAGGFAAHQQEQASADATAAEAAALHADATRLGAQASSGRNRYDLALLLAAQAYTMQPGVQSESDLFRTLLQGDSVRAVRPYPDLAQDVELSPDGRWFYTVSQCSHVQRWPVATLTTSPAQEVFAGNGSCGPETLGFTPDGTVMMGVGGEPTTVEPVGFAKDTSEGPAAVAPGEWGLSPDGTHGAGLRFVGGSDYSAGVVVWALAAPGRAVTVPLRAPGVAAATCGEFLCVLTADHRVERISFVNPRVIASIAVPGAASDTLVDSERPLHVVASPDGRTVLVPRDDKELVLVDLATGRGTPLPGATDDAAALAFSRDGRYLAARDGADLLVYDLDGGLQPLRLHGHSGRIMTAAFTADDYTVMSVAEDHVAIVWDLSGRHRVGRVLTSALGPDDNFQVSTLWAAGSRIVAGTHEGGLLFIDPATGAITRRTERRASPQGFGFGTVRTGLGGTSAIAVSADGTTSIWDLTTASLRTVVSGLPALADAYGGDAWVSPDGRWAATLRDSSGVNVLDMATGQVVRTLPLPTTGAEVSWAVVLGWTADGSGVIVSRQSNDPRGDEMMVIDNPSGAHRWSSFLPWTPEEAVADLSGRSIAVGGDDGVLSFLDPRTGTKLGADFSPNGLQIYNLASSPDGRWLSLSGGPPQAMLVDAATHEAVGGPLPIDAGARDARARFLPDGSLAVVTGRTLRVFDTDPAHWLARACAEAGRTLTKDEWAQYLPGRPYAPVCSAT